MIATANLPIDIDTLASWEELTEAGRISVGDMDKLRWYQGALANRVVKLFVRPNAGDDTELDHTMKEFAKDIGEPYKTICQRRQMDAFYLQSTRENFLAVHPNLTYTHLRHAMRLLYVGLAYAFLETASDEGWTTDQTGLEVGKMLGGGGGNGNRDTVTVPIRYNEDTGEVTVTFKSKLLLLDNGVYKITIEKA